MKIIGLTGGIGSGKSTVAKEFASLGVTVIDADHIARDIVEPGMPALNELADAFGGDIIKDDGHLNRGLLAERAFSSPEKTAQLSSITHPRIRERTEALFESYRKAGHPIVIWDVPLLVDKGYHRHCDAVIVVDTCATERLRRLVHLRGLSEKDANARIAAQISDTERLQVADFVIDNNGSLDAIPAHVSRILQRLRDQ
ncbi:dephospho-CoA kinase [Corynebacterium sp. ES2794-CONJ1]|uniref:dephospho-CoA kinase n=1 Tax=unclassified Corynebacterium TaxID=2624378 RepID=UPI00216A750C|nr:MULTISPECIES: dephospho-CoA kinase [unclassified Corynebacterium]MCS4490742.1 dephospho-CoA kinase [Corynebacterium sp. ES2775-CONJ]MCS4492544.1 dephospho-CoA kinase [Corynebacterium sp. ES2715-CONJ3]MCS4532645.1 dephospho-CoA kinase [Corynebacterium sp. ES2730-CONJ]MCU9520040.1 dephospho-CoA kinase [Corynebacterium sp. ES2794-CONJ1]